MRNQDAKSIRHIYETYYTMVEKYVVGNGGSEQDVPDIFQESIIILHEQVNSEDFKLTSDLKGFFFGIVRIRWKKALDRRGRYISLEEDIADYDSSEASYNELLSETGPTLKRIIARSMSKLKAKCRLIFHMGAEGATEEEIVKALNLSGKDVLKVTRGRCRESLLGFIRKDPDFSDDLL